MKDRNDMSAVTEAIIYRCPVCGDKVTFSRPGTLGCSKGHVFFIKNGIIDFTSPGILPPGYDDPLYQRWLEISLQALSESYKPNSKIGLIQDHGHAYLESLAGGNSGWKLDLGCGFGRHYDFLKSKEKVVGFDANHDSLKAASDKNRESIFIKGNMEKLPFFDNQFAVVFAIYSLEHVYDLSKAVKEIKRVLAKGGRLLVGLPAEGGLLHNGLRRLTTIPYFSKKYSIDYNKIVKIEHCNTAGKVLAALGSEFKCKKTRFYPFRIKWLHVNLTVMAFYENAYK